MPLTPNFSTEQSYSFPSEITFNDTSTGSNISIVGRLIEILTANGTYLVPDGNSSDQFITWALADSSITVDVLGGTSGKDYAASVTVYWVDVNGDTVNSKTYVLGFTIYNENFDFTLSQMLSVNSPLMNDNSFFQKKGLLRTYIDSGNQAISLASDYLTAQLCYDAATALRRNSNYLFNINS